MKRGRERAHHTNVSAAEGPPLRAPGWVGARPTWTCSGLPTATVPSSSIECSAAPMRGSGSIPRMTPSATAGAGWLAETERSSSLTWSSSASKRCLLERSSATWASSAAIFDS
eukprot:scaffold80198_cov73-Phaeocystis_antarctica.AAC.4